MNTINSPSNAIIHENTASFKKQLYAKKSDCDNFQHNNSTKCLSQNTKRLSNSENESGFSSMCSFLVPSLNEIGLPLNKNDVILNITNSKAPCEVDVLWV